MSEWKESKLGDVGVVVTGKTPSSKNPDDFGSYIPFVTPTDYKNYHKVVSSSQRFLSSVGANRLDNKILPPNSIMVTCIGSDMGKVAVNTIPVITNQQINSVICDVRKVDSDFLYYKLVESYDTLRSYGLAGTAVPIVNKTDFEGIGILLPPLPEQRAIAGVLSSLDDKIDLLHRQNKTLEGMAAAVFRHFFVDNRKATWQECTVSELADHEKTSIHPNRNPDTLFYHYSIPAFDESHTPVHELGALIQSNKYEVMKNTILFSKLNPHKDKRVWLIPSSIARNSVCSTEFQVMNPKAEKHLFFLYGFISHPENYDQIAAGVGGTSSSHQRIDPEVIFDFKCFLPDDTTLTEYNAVVTPIYSKMQHNLKAVQALKRQRDLLLPKLMSGEVRVKL
jgi:type I restriction enzyme S subunit